MFVCLMYQSILIFVSFGEPFHFVVIFQDWPGLIILTILDPLISKWILPSVFQFLQKKKKTCWIFDRDSVESVNQFGHIYHLNNVNLPTHEHFPFTYIFFNFFHWCFVVFGIQVLNLLNLFLSILLFLMLLQMELLFSFHSGLSNASV